VQNDSTNPKNEVIWGLADSEDSSAEFPGGYPLGDLGSSVEHKGDVGEDVTDEPEEPVLAGPKAPRRVEPPPLFRAEAGAFPSMAGRISALQTSRFRPQTCDYDEDHQGVPKPLQSRHLEDHHVAPGHPPQRRILGELFRPSEYAFPKNTVAMYLARGPARYHGLGVLQPRSSSTTRALRTLFGDARAWYAACSV
jgi:hypothetical protein